MKKLLKKQIVFTWTLKGLALLSKWKFSEKGIPFLTKLLAKLNIILNKPKPTKEIKELAELWTELMPPDGKEYFKIAEITPDTAYVQIHLHCPLRETGKINTCYKFMNYDRKLMESVGGSLTVLESQSNSGKNYCTLAIRRLEDNKDDLIPAHER